MGRAPINAPAIMIPNLSRFVPDLPLNKDNPNCTVQLPGLITKIKGPNKSFQFHRKVRIPAVAKAGMAKGMNIIQ